MVIQEENEARRARLNGVLKDFVYRRLLLTREIEQLDIEISKIEGAINENEMTRRDVLTEDQIKKQKEAQKDVTE